MRKNEDPIILEETFSSSLKDVWSALTTKEKMQKWFFKNIPEFNARCGFTIQFLVISNDKQFIHLWEVIESVSEEKLVLNWNYKGYLGDSVVVFELSNHKGETRLKLTHTVTEDFPEDIREFRRESCLEGWKYFVKDSLKAYLTKGIEKSV